MFRVFFTLKKQKVEQIAPNTATISRANVVVRPVSASLVESFIPRKLTRVLFSEGRGVIGALVPVEKMPRLTFMLNRLLTVTINLNHICFSHLKCGYRKIYYYLLSLNVVSY